MLTSVPSSAIDDDISKFDYSSATNVSWMFDAGALNKNAYSDLLINFANNTSIIEMSIDNSGTKYRADAATARSTLINTRDWSISDSGQE